MHLLSVAIIVACYSGRKYVWRETKFNFKKSFPGTMMAYSKTGLNKWLMFLYLIMKSKKFFINGTYTLFGAIGKQRVVVTVKATAG